MADELTLDDLPDEEDHREIGGMPVPALQAPASLEHGDTPIHDHPAKDEIVQLLATYALEPEGNRPSYTELEEFLASEYELEFPRDTPGRYIRTFLDRFVAPALFVTPAFVRRGLARLSGSMNTAAMKLEMAHRMKRRFEQADRDPETDHGDAARLAKTAADLIDAAEDSMERFDAIPSSSSGAMVEKADEVNFNVEGALDHVSGSEPVDTTARAHEDDE